jgi:hypothetical protein
MGCGFEGGKRLKELDIVVHIVLGQWDTVLKGRGDWKELDVVVLTVMGQWDTVLKEGGDWRIWR